MNLGGRKLSLTSVACVWSRAHIRIKRGSSKLISGARRLQCLHEVGLLQAVGAAYPLLRHDRFELRDSQLGEVGGGVRLWSAGAAAEAKRANFGRLLLEPLADFVCRHPVLHRLRDFALDRVNVVALRGDGTSVGMVAANIAHK